MSDHDQPVAANLLGRSCSDAPDPNQRWVGDTTEFVIGGSGKLYLAAVLDLSRGSSWAGRSARQRSACDDIKALDMALKRRCPDVGLLHPLRSGLHVRERSSYQAVLETHGITCSMKPARELLRQRRDGEFLLERERKRRGRPLRQLRRGPKMELFRLHRSGSITSRRRPLDARPD